MYGKHPNDGMTEVDSRNVTFLKDSCQVSVKSNRTLSYMIYN